MKSTRIIMYSQAALILVSVLLASAVGQESVSRQRLNEANGSPKYRIAYRRRDNSAPTRLRLHISVEPKHFNRADMASLARRLNTDFRNEQELNVVICDEYKAAKSPGIIYDLLRREPPLALRGFYELDRAKGKEGISFSTERGKPLDEIDIDFSKEP
jgi:hypothetical protein